LVAHDGRRDWEQDAWRGEAGFVQRVVDQVAVDASVTVFKRVGEHEGKGDRGGGQDGVDLSPLQPRDQPRKACHEGAHVFRLGADEVDDLPVLRRGFADEVLEIASPGRRIAVIDDDVLQPGLVPLAGRIEVADHPQYLDEEL